MRSITFLTAEAIFTFLITESAPFWTLFLDDPACFWTLFLAAAYTDISPDDLACLWTLSKNVRFWTQSEFDFVAEPCLSTEHAHRLTAVSLFTTPFWFHQL